MHLELQNYLDANPIETMIDLEDEPGEFVTYFLKTNNYDTFILEMDKAAPPSMFKKIEKLQKNPELNNFHVIDGIVGKRCRSRLIIFLRGDMSRRNHTEVHVTNESGDVRTTKEAGRNYSRGGRHLCLKFEEYFNELSPSTCSYVQTL